VTSRHNLWIAEFLPWFSCPDIFSVIPSALHPSAGSNDASRRQQMIGTFMFLSAHAHGLDHRQLPMEDAVKI
jgi:hypothetical protein